MYSTPMHTLRQGELDKLVRAHAAYLKALEEAERRKTARDHQVLAATEGGATRAQIAEALGLTRGRVQQIVERARG